jgi:hypothetical protein
MTLKYSRGKQFRYEEKEEDARILKQLSIQLDRFYHYLEYQEF